MKKIFQLIACLALSGTIITTYAQSQEQTTPLPSSQTPQTQQRVTDPMVSDRLAKDLSTRNSATSTQTVNWHQTNYGYTGNYAIGSANYMARYDQQGNYVETLRRGNWSNSTVPTALINAYNQSSYKDQTVTGYWSVTDPGKTGYYLELQNTRGEKSNVWADSQGNFTTAPYNSTTARPGSIPKD